MAFQAMNHGLEARATSPQELETFHNSQAESALVTWIKTYVGRAPRTERRSSPGDDARGGAGGLQQKAHEIARQAKGEQ